MADPQAPADSRSAKDPVMFAERKPESGGSSPLPWVIAGAAVLVLALVVFFATRRKPAATSGVQAAAPYASSLAVSDLQMSEGSALSSVKLTYIDGVLRNNGTQTVTAATAQVQFNNDTQMPPQLETVPVTLIRTREPYVDTEQISAAPIPPGGHAEFRLIFENVTENWNQQYPVIRLTEVSTK